VVGQGKRQRNKHGHVKANVRPKFVENTLKFPEGIKVILIVFAIGAAVLGERAETLRGDRDADFGLAVLEELHKLICTVLLNQDCLSGGDAATARKTILKGNLTNFCHGSVIFRTLFFFYQVWSNWFCSDFFRGLRHRVRFYLPSAVINVQIKFLCTSVFPIFLLWN